MMKKSLGMSQCDRSLWPLVLKEHIFFSVRGETSLSLNGVAVLVRWQTQAARCVGIQVPSVHAMCRT